MKCPTAFKFMGADILPSFISKGCFHVCFCTRTTCTCNLVKSNETFSSL
jgi:hypothetical protein